MLYLDAIEADVNALAAVAPDLHASGGHIGMTYEEIASAMYRSGFTRRRLSAASIRTIEQGALRKCRAMLGVQMLAAEMYPALDVASPEWQDALKLEADHAA